MRQFVLDASVAAAWCLPDAVNDYSEAVLELLSSEAEALVPPLWSFEITNVLLMALREKRIRQGAVNRLLSSLDALNITVDAPGRERGLDRLIAMALSNGLTTYDAAYLELALRRGVPLATLDKSLRRAAAKEGVELLNRR